MVRHTQFYHDIKFKGEIGKIALAISQAPLTLFIILPVWYQLYEMWMFDQLFVAALEAEDRNW